jgi:hypothetical protein
VGNGHYALWEEHRIQGESADMSLSANLLDCCEWIRMLVGRCLALAKQTSLTADHRRLGVPEWSFLVLGIPARQLKEMQDQDGLQLAAHNVRADFAQLRSSCVELRKLLSDKSRPIPSPEAFLRNFDLLYRLQLPINPDCWKVTDEGLSIIGWGLGRESGRGLLEWTDDQLKEMEARLLGDLVGASGTTGTTAPNKKLIEFAMKAQGRQKPAAKAMVNSREWLAWALVLVMLCVIAFLVLRLRAVGARNGPHTSPDPVLVPSPSPQPADEKPVQAPNTDGGTPKSPGQSTNPQEKPVDKSPQSRKSKDAPAKQSDKTQTPTGQPASPPPQQTESRGKPADVPKPDTKQGPAEQSGNSQTPAGQPVNPPPQSQESKDKPVEAPKPDTKEAPAKPLSNSGPPAGQPVNPPPSPPESKDKPVDAPKPDTKQDPPKQPSNSPTNWSRSLQ